MSDVMPIAGGAFIGVVGPSGAGKDAVMRFAQQALAGDGRFHFVRRVITRPLDGIGEDHQPISPQAFDLLRTENRLALHWEAHGKCYGIPIEMDAFVAAGGVVIANLSRTVLAEMTRRYARFAIVEITARPDILQQRLAMRGRESESDIQKRLARKVVAPPPADMVAIDNSGVLEISGMQFLELLKLHLPSAASRP